MGMSYKSQMHFCVPAANKKENANFKYRGIHLTKIANISVYKIILLKLILKDVNTR